MTPLGVPECSAFPSARRSRVLRPRITGSKTCKQLIFKAKKGSVPGCLPESSKKAPSPNHPRITRRMAPFKAKKGSVPELSPESSPNRPRIVPESPQKRLRPRITPPRITSKKAPSPNHPPRITPESPVGWPHLRRKKAPSPNRHPNRHRIKILQVTDIQSDIQRKKGSVPESSPNHLKKGSVPELSPESSPNRPRITSKKAPSPNRPRITRRMAPFREESEGCPVGRGTEGDSVEEK
jgi:hypothetical protein